VTGSWAPVRPFAVVVGATVALIGGLILLGWLVESPALILPVPGLALTHSSSGLLYLLLGGAVAALATGRVAPARLAIATALLLVALLGLEALAGVDVGVGRALTPDRSWLEEGVPHPGRFSVTTGLWALLTALALAALAMRDRTAAHEAAAGVLGLGVTVTVGFVVLLRLLMQAEERLGLAAGEISPHAVILFPLLGTAVAALAWQGRASPLASTWGALVVGVVPLSLTVGLWWTVTELDRRRLADGLAAEARVALYGISREMDGLLGALERIADLEALAPAGATSKGRLDMLPAARWLARQDDAAGVGVIAVAPGAALPPGGLEFLAREVERDGHPAPGARGFMIPANAGGGADLLLMAGICPPPPGACTGRLLAGVPVAEHVTPHLLPLLDRAGVMLRSGADTLFSNMTVADEALPQGVVAARVAGEEWTMSVAALGGVRLSRPSSLGALVLLTGALTTLFLLLALGFAGLARRRAERIERQKRTLEDSERRFRTVFDSGFQAQALLDVRGSVLALNRTGASLTGVGQGAAMGHALWDLSFWGGEGETIEWIRTACERARDGRTMHRTAELRGAKGQPVVVDLALRPVQGGSGDVTHLLMEARDVTEQRQAEQANRELQTLGTMGRMAARVAHEINNPLQGIQNGFQLIKGGISPDHPHYRFVGAIEREITRIASVTRQLYDTYRPEHQTATACSIPLLLSDLAALLSQVNRGAGVEIAVEQDDSVMGAMALPEGLVRQILMNLAQNAIDETPRGGTVTLVATRAGPDLVLSVLDQGPGITPEMQQRMFDPFVSAKPGHARSGMGMGLSLVRRAASALGATIEVDASPSGGTVFTVRIPIAPSAVGPAPSPETELADPGVILTPT
jgi:PAS domain S-box-containing protein